MGKGLGMKKHELAYLDSKIADLGVFDEETQRQLLELRHEFHLFNEEVESAGWYFKLTFDSGMSDQNLEIVKLGIEQSYQHILGRAREIVERINVLVPIAERRDRVQT